VLLSVSALTIKISYCVQCIFKQNFNPKESATLQGLLQFDCLASERPRGIRKYEVISVSSEDMETEGCV
jgi:hypothetical protein